MTCARNILLATFFVSNKHISVNYGYIANKTDSIVSIQELFVHLFVPESAVCIYLQLINYDAQAWSSAMSSSSVTGTFFFSRP